MSESHKTPDTESVVSEEQPVESSGDQQPSSPKGTKRPAPDSSESAEAAVHSANDWEHANLGDSGRKSKFLRLLGANKKDHYGTFVIGEQERSTERTAERSSDLQHGLEEQFDQGIEHKRTSGFRGHKGLGFHQEEAPKDAPDGDQTISSTEKPSDETNTESQNENSEENGKETPEKESPPDSSTSPVVGNKYAELGFVKSSS